MTPVQEAVLQALVNNINLSLRNGISPQVIAQQSLQVEGHPLIKELSQFMEELQETPAAKANGTKARQENGRGEETTRRQEKNLILDREKEKGDHEEREKCSGCGATQLRQNGTCMLCEICGETTGCS